MQNVAPDLDPNYLTLMIFLKEFFEKVDFEKNQQTTKSMINYTGCKEFINQISLNISCETSAGKKAHEMPGLISPEKKDITKFVAYWCLDCHFKG